MRRGLAVTVLSLMVLTPLLWTEDASARAGRGGSGGSRGSRSHSAPARPSPSHGSVTPGQPASAPSSPAAVDAASSRGGVGAVGGLLAGGLLGALLFGGGGGGMGVFDMLALAGLAFVAFRLLKGRAQAPAPSYAGGAMSGGYGEYPRPRARPVEPEPAPMSAASDLEAGVGRIRQIDPDFDKAGFAQTATDAFMKVQGAWSARDMRPISALLTPEMLGYFQQDCEQMKAQGRVNRIEDIAMRAADVVEAWQEKGQDYVTVRVEADLLDYTTDEKTGEVVEGNRSAPTTFEEFWTFTRPVWAKSWRLSAVQQPVPASS